MRWCGGFGGVVVWWCRRRGRGQTGGDVCATVVVDRVVDRVGAGLGDGTSRPPRPVRQRLGIAGGLDFGINFRPSHRLAQTCETQAVDPFVDQFRDLLLDRFSTLPA